MNRYLVIHSLDHSDSVGVYLEHKGKVPNELSYIEEIIQTDSQREGHLHHGGCADLYRVTTLDNLQMLHRYIVVIQR